MSKRKRGTEVAARVTTHDHNTRSKKRQRVVDTAALDPMTDDDVKEFIRVATQAQNEKKRQKTLSHEDTPSDTDDVKEFIRIATQTENGKDIVHQIMNMSRDPASIGLQDLQSVLFLCSLARNYSGHIDREIAYVHGKALLLGLHKDLQPENPEEVMYMEYAKLCDAYPRLRVCQPYDVKWLMTPENKARFEKEIAALDQGARNRWLPCNYIFSLI